MDEHFKVLAEVVGQALAEAWLEEQERRPVASTSNANTHKSKAIPKSRTTRRTRICGASKPNVQRTSS